MNVPRYQLTGIQAFCRNTLALQVDELSISEGGLHLLVGPNGSGKSTLLGVLAFLKKPDRGEILFRGRNVEWRGHEIQMLRRRVTLLHQQSFLFSGSVFNNVAFGLRVRQVKREELQRPVSECLAAVGLAGLESRNARQLSGGETRRVALARALACRPEVLLLDEPLAHVDNQSCDIIEKLILRLSQQGITVVMATHDDRPCNGHVHSQIHLADGRIDRIVEGPQASKGTAEGRSYARV
jgi:tungstate transport system ATP-binding protein